ncbi:WcbI family polysaccharide biosynthesis putative acetyltransferase [Oceaniglobus roseus]|uniref:WcbI family polysaccharide biosynthesis putative acetyltransferase n=1 Tax=Oceaniglobus roseus TaxID=1737570 RepID=UPI000C7EA07C|nr:WcbI family polysaccharide biosynthesis putative acetyltransferase [Kandeliimicrobium roseum]
MPYIFLDGFFSLCAAPSAKSAHGVINWQICAQEIENFGLDVAVARFKNGLTDFRHKERFEFNRLEMMRREGICDYKALDFILSRPRRSMLTHNHPKADVLVEIARQVAEHVNLDFDVDACNTPASQANLTLPLFCTVLSPYGIEELELDWEPDLSWFINGRTLYRQIHALMQSRRILPEEIVSK